MKLKNIFEVCNRCNNFSIEYDEWSRKKNAYKGLNMAKVLSFFKRIDFNTEYMRGEPF